MARLTFANAQEAILPEVPVAPMHSMCFPGQDGSIATDTRESARNP